MFNQYVAEQVGWYVYALRDPRDRRVFYIGKGKGNRVFQHAEAAQASSGDAEMGQKLELIKDIHRSGDAVEAFMLRHSLPSEKVAYDIEAAVIDALQLLDSETDNPYFSLTNLVRGHHHAQRGLAHVDVITSLFDAPPAPPIRKHVMLIKIPGLWTPQMTPGDLYEATRKWWVVGTRRNKANYAFSVNRGVVREVYKIDSWREWTSEERGKSLKSRWGFEGSVAEQLAVYRNTSVRDLYKRGSANPVMYVNC